MTKTPHESPLAAYRLLLCEKQDFLNNHLARVSVTPYQQGTHETRDEVLSNVGAQNIDTSGYQASDLDDNGFYWEKDQLSVNAVFTPGIDTILSPTEFDDLEMGGSAGNPFLLKEEDKGNSPSKHQSLRDQQGPLHSSEVVRLEQD